MTCKYCNKEKKTSHSCLGSSFYQGDKTKSTQYISSETLLKETHPDVLANFSFHVEKKDIWWLDKRIQVNINDNKGKKESFYLEDELCLFDFTANKVLNEFANKLNYQRNLGTAKLQANITEPNNRDLLKNSTPTSNQISELIKQELSQIDLVKYLKQLETLTGQNQDNINTLQISPEENAQAIARLQAIQSELAKRKKIAQELEQTKIGQQLQEQKQQLEIVQRQIEAKGREFESANQAGKTSEAKKINEEYNELRRKQSAVTALIVNLEENAAYRTFVKFDSLTELYNPDHSIVNNSQVEITQTEIGFMEKTVPYLKWGLGGLVIIGLLYFVHRYFFKEIS